MVERREPTISGIRVDPDEARQRAAAPGDRSRQGARPTPPAQRPVIVQKTSSGLAFFALVLALAAGGGAGYLYWQNMLMTQQLSQASQRIADLEKSLQMTGDQSSASAQAMQAKLVWADSEIRKLWGVSNDRNKKIIAENKADIAQLEKDVKGTESKVAASVKNVQDDLKVVSDLVDAQQSAITRADKQSADISAQIRALNEKMAKLDRTFSDISRRVENSEKDIDAINGFRRTVNQQLLELKGNSTSAPK